MINRAKMANTRAVFAVIGFLVLAPTTGADTDVALDLEQYRGNVVVLDFWASWCVPCRRSFPWLNDIHDRYEKDGLVIIGVNVDKQREPAAAFLQQFPANFRIRYDPEAALAREFNVQGMPSSYVIGRDGKLKASHIGFKVRKQGQYEAAIVAALGENTE